jgi:hypothetical protein
MVLWDGACKSICVSFFLLAEDLWDQLQCSTYIVGIAAQQASQFIWLPGRICKKLQAAFAQGTKVACCLGTAWHSSLIIWSAVPGRHTSQLPHRIHHKSSTRFQSWCADPPLRLCPWCALLLYYFDQMFTGCYLSPKVFMPAMYIVGFCTHLRNKLANSGSPFGNCWPSIRG